MLDVTLQVNGTNYGGWQTVKVTLGMEQCANSFELTVSDRWPGRADRWPILPGMACKVLIGSSPVITGYIDDTNPGYDKSSHSIHVTGRDKAGDLVDCAAIHKTGEWHNADLQKIVSDICYPFGISVLIKTATGKPFTRFALQECETAFEAIERACRMRGVLSMSDGQGNLVLTRAGSEKIPTALVQGENIEKASGRFSHKDRHSRYIIKGQHPGGDWSTPEQHAQTKAHADDAAITRYRPLIILAEQGDGSTYQDRAVWERNVRAGRGSRATYTVTSWSHAGGLWRPNRLVSVHDDYLGTPAEMIISAVTFSLDESGSTTEIEVCRQEAFALINLPDKKKHKKESLVW